MRKMYEKLGVMLIHQSANALPLLSPKKIGKSREDLNSIVEHD